MKVLFQSIATKSYLKTPQHWARHLEKAKNFEYLETAAQFIHQWNLNNVQFAMALPEAGEIIVVPVLPV